jgi:hypothetical protein
VQVSAPPPGVAPPPVRPKPAFSRSPLTVSIPGSAVTVGTLIVLMSFQINLHFAGLPLAWAAAYVTFLLSFLLLLRGRFTRTQAVLLVVAMVVGGAFGKPVHGLGMGAAACFGFTAAARQPRALHRVLQVFFVVNLAVVVMQFLGLNDLVFAYVNYANQADRISVFDPDFGFPAFLPQVRPSGLFPAPTYVSAYCVLLLVQLHGRRGDARIFPIGVGLFLAMLGSTLGFVLVLVGAVLAIRVRQFRWTVAAYVVGLAVYAVLMPLQFAYHFHTEAMMLSVSSRLDVANVTGESIIQNNPLVFVAISTLALLGSIFVVVWSRLRALLSLIPFVVSLLLPPLVHNVSTSIFYWFVVSASFAFLVADIRRRPTPAVDRPLRHARTRAQPGSP